MRVSQDPIEPDATRGRSSTRSCQHMKFGAKRIDPPASIGSLLTIDTIPRSLSPSSRTSKYAANVLKTYKMRLRGQVLDAEGSSEYPGVRFFVTSMPYSYSRLRLSGYYSGSMDAVSKLPDGEGILFCNNGKRLAGIWLLGEIQASCLDLTRRSRVGDSLLSCDSSNCSSLSASVTRQASPDFNETKKIKIPKNFDIVIHTPMPIDFHDKDDVKAGIFKAPRPAITRMVSRGNESEYTDKTHPISRMDSIDSGRYGKESKKLLQSFAVVSKVKTSINFIRRRV